MSQTVLCKKVVLVIMIMIIMLIGITLALDEPAVVLKSNKNSTSSPNYLINNLPQIVLSHAAASLNLIPPPVFKKSRVSYSSKNQSLLNYNIFSLCVYELQASF